MVVFSYYPADPRVRREAEALVEKGMTVDIFCLKKNGERFREDYNGVNIYRLLISRIRAGKLLYIFEYLIFVFIAFVTLSFNQAIKPYQVVHVHNMPDFLIFCATLPKLVGSKLILDLHDPMPEVYMAKYSINYRNSLIKILLFLENISIKFADLIITPNTSFRNLFISRSCPDNKIHIVMNSPDEKIFQISRYVRDKNGGTTKNKFVVMYHGTITERNGLDIALDAISILRRKIPNLIFSVYGEGDYVDSFLQKAKLLNLTDLVYFHGYISLDKIPEKILSCDVGLIPNKSNPFTQINMPTRIFEYLSLRKPVIVPRTKGILDYFDDNSMFFFKAGDPEGLAKVIFDVFNDNDIVSHKLQQGIIVYEKYRWQIQKEYYASLVAGLLKNGR